MRNRVHSIDALRGFFAILVLFYHCSCWCKPYFPLPDFLQNALTLWGIYAVEGFFVISGISLALAYKTYSFCSLEDYYKFLIRRYIRIVPLYAFLMIFFTSFFKYIDQLFMVFGFKNPLSSCLIGGWSIGVEFCLYFFFPFLIILIRMFIGKILCFLGSFSLLVASIFIFKLRYVNPCQHLFFFVTGIILGCHFKNQYTSNSYKYAIISCFLFMAMSLLGPTEQKFCLENATRLFWAVGTCTLVYLSSKIEVKHEIFQFLGKISYGLYLVHPIFVWKILPRVGMRNSYFVVPCTFVFSMISAYLIFRFIETPTQRFLKKLLHA